MSSAIHIREALQEASSFLTAAGISEPDANARLLLGHVLGLSPASLLASQREPFPEDRKVQWEQAITRKAEGEPAQYITGEQEFYGLTFKVNPAVLIPRPETELLVERIVQLGSELWPQERRGSAGPSAGGGTALAAEAKPCAARDSAAAAGAAIPSYPQPLAADIGTGSGAIAAALKQLRPEWRVMASDISPAALETAKSNAAELGLEIAFREGNLLEPFQGMKLDILVSNPPYIPAAVIEGLQPEVKDFEPRSALDGGEDGLDPYRIMMRQLVLLAAPPRLIGFELGMGQAGDVAGLLRQAGHWTRIETIRDYAGIERHVIGIAESE
ncbi:protein-(glutamine-N5) methyltransferase, release factor-specific [Paenibacillus yonginensis]|uniref:Release factor glutamine methyltransferase n=2 Tax=Paenibacillus yonginensis TaxID=1462996 RepID=A0A1B1N7E1_9BACL|nr:HemK/PrmC family methyltransferase [Paenibacillus yonginensis]ANS77305.1 protein-(glutamine-N5) methyltransferase, release factor-specific [Paenibacillus yonginensis]